MSRSSLIVDTTASQRGSNHTKTDQVFLLPNSDPLGWSGDTASATNCLTVHTASTGPRKRAASWIKYSGALTQNKCKCTIWRACIDESGADCVAGGRCDVERLAHSVQVIVQRHIEQFLAC